MQNLLSSDGAVHNDPVPANVLEDAAISRGRAPTIMFGSQPIHGDDKVQVPKRGPFDRNWPNRASHQLHFNPHPLQFGKQLAQLAVSHQRFSTDDGNVKWAVPANQS
jgi:hypothetical protein